MENESISPRRAQTRDRLIDAALTIFAERGVAGSSVEEVCDAAGFSRGAFYSNFASKNELLLAVFRRMADTSMAAAKEVFETLPGEELRGDPDSVIRKAVEIVISQGTDDHSVLVRSEVRLVAMRQADLCESFYELETELLGTFAQLLDTAAERYHLRFAVDSLTAVRWMSAVFDHEVGDAIMRGKPFGPESVSGLATMVSWLIQTESEPISG